MPKPIKERATSNPLGQKINAVMREKGIEGDYAALAAVFEVRTPSVYDWITHGRLAKERFGKLVEWSGRSLDWWFDVPTQARNHYNNTNSVPLHAAERNVIFSVPSRASPFTRITSEEWNSLSPEALREIEIYAMGLITGQRLSSDTKRQNGTK